MPCFGNTQEKRRSSGEVEPCGSIGVFTRFSLPHPKVTEGRNIFQVYMLCCLPVLKEWTNMSLKLTVQRAAKATILMQPFQQQHVLVLPTWKCPLTCSFMPGSQGKLFGLHLQPGRRCFQGIETRSSLELSMNHGQDFQRLHGVQDGVC